MKAPSVREGTKENGTQVTERRSQTLQALLQEMVENLFTGLWLANPRLRLGADPQKFPRCRSRSGDGDRPSKIHSNRYKLCPA